MAPFAPSPRLTLIASALGFVVVMLDVSVVNVALGALHAELSADIEGLQWVVTAYTLVFAALLLSTGALGDRFGARRVFLAGFWVFGVASTVCALSTGLPLLIAGRLCQGLGAALLVPNSLVLVQRAFAHAEQRSRAVGWWSASGGVALAAGPVLGGLLVTHLGWRSIFLINVPIGLLGIWLTLRFVSADEASPRRSLDWQGQATAIVALAAITLALTKAALLGWSNALVLALLSLGTLAALGFIRIETRSPSPMLPLELFQTRQFTLSLMIGVVVNLAYYGLVFVFSLFFQMEQHLSAQLTGLAFLPMTAVLMAANVLAGRLVTRWGVRWLMTTGLAAAAFGYLLLLPVSVDSAYWLLVAPMLLAAGGIALVVPTLTNATLSSVGSSRSGVASGMLNSARQIGGLLGVALFGSWVSDLAPDAFVQGMRMSIGTAAVLLLLASAGCWFGMRRTGEAAVGVHASGSEE